MPKAFLKAGVQRSFYDLGKHGYFKPVKRDNLDIGFDTTRTIAEAQMADWEASAEKSRKHRERQEAVRAQMKERAKDRAGVPDLSPMACGGGRQQMREPAD